MELGCYRVKKLVLVLIVLDFLVLFNSIIYFCLCVTEQEGLNY
jgi:hypothetical protein